ncbi:hypothetical protein Emag_000618 [Eimeria magna]
MDEIHAVLELFVSCRGSGWPLVRLEAVQQLLTQHLLMAAPMDKEEVADMIKTCFEADNNGEINFLSFWAGMENLLELLGLRDQGTFVDDKVYGLQVFRDGLLAEALRKHEGPTSGVLLARDEVLHIIDETNKSVTSRRNATSSDDLKSRRAVDAESHSWSSPFWDEVYRETEQLDHNSVLSISELSMMVFGFLKTYIQENSQVKGSDQASQNDEGFGVDRRLTESPVRASASGSSSVISEGDYVSHTGSLGSPTSGVSRQRAENTHRTGFTPEVSPGALHEAAHAGGAVVSTKKWQGKPDEEQLEAQPLGRSRRGNSEPGAGCSMFEGGESNLHSQEQATSASHADAAAFLKAIQGDQDDPRKHEESPLEAAVIMFHSTCMKLDGCTWPPFGNLRYCTGAQLRQLLLVAGRITEEVSMSKKAVQELRYLNAAAVDCLDRLSVEHDKRNDEISDAALSLRRMRTEKQQLVERLTSLEHQHSQLQLQHEQQACDREQLDQLKAALSAERQERERFEHLFQGERRGCAEKARFLWTPCDTSASKTFAWIQFLLVLECLSLRALADKQDEAQRVNRENEKLMEQLKLQSEDFTRRREAMQKEQIALAAEHERKTELLNREKESLEEQLRSAEDTARAAEAARKQLQGDKDSNASALRQRISELEEEKRRYEAEAEENDTLITQLQGRLEEKMQQVTILEVKNKQQLRLLQQVRSVRDSLMQLLQETKEREADAAVPKSSASRTAQQSHEVLRLRAGLKSAQAHIKELETFVDEILPLRALPTLGAELEMSGTASSPKSLLEGSDPDTGRLVNVECSALKVPDVPADGISDPGSGLSNLRLETPNNHDVVGVRNTGQAQRSATPFDAPDPQGSSGKGLPQASAHSPASGSAEPSHSRHRHHSGRRADSVGFSSHLVPGSLKIWAVVGFYSDAYFYRYHIFIFPYHWDTSSSRYSGVFAAGRRLVVCLDALRAVDNSYRDEGQAQSARATRRSGSLDRAAGSPMPDSQALDLRVSKAATGAASSPHLPAPEAYNETPFQNERASTALEILLGGKRRLSRRSSNSSTAQQQRASAATSSVLSLPDLNAEPAELVAGGFRESNFLSDSRGSAASDGSFLMLSSPKESVNSPGGASRKGKSHRPAQELANRPLDAGTLSNMFGMLGACAALPSHSERVVRQADEGQQKTDKVRNAGERQDSGPSTPKSRSKQPARLSAAAAAAVSSRDVSGFRSLRRLSHGSEHSLDQAKECSGLPSTLPAGNNMRTRSSREADAFDTSRSRALDPRGSAADSAKWSPKCEQLYEASSDRARRTVSRGLSEATAKHEAALEAHVGSIGSLQQKDSDALSNRFGRSGVNAIHAGQQNDTGMSTPAMSVTSMELDKRQQSKTVAGGAGGAGASRRGREESMGEARDFLEGEPCRSEALSHSKRNARSRSSSSDSSRRGQRSPRGGTVGQRQHELPTSNRKGEVKQTGKSQESYGTSKSSQHTNNTSEDPASVRTPTSSATAHKESHGLSTVEQKEVDHEPAQHGQETAFPFTSSRSPQSSSTQVTPFQQLQHVLSQDRVKLQDDQTASAAALLAAAAGVVDASLHQQQQMIQRQQEHHEDLQRAQQRRIDMLQEQLESLQRSKEQQRESGEQQQKQIIESLQAKLEELQRRQEQRDHDFQEAQRKLLQEELQTQLQQKFAELQCSPGSTNVDVAAPQHLSKGEHFSIQADGLGASACGGRVAKAGYSSLTAAPASLGDGFRGEANSQAVRLQEGEWNGTPGVYASYANTSRTPSGGSAACVPSVLLSRRQDEEAMNAFRWHNGEEDQLDGADHSSFRCGDDFQLHLGSSISRVNEHDDAKVDSDETSSCASSSIMGSQYGVMCPVSAVEDMPTTSSSPLLSQAATPGACSSLSSQRAGHFAAAQKRDPQAPAFRGERLTPQLLQAHSLESAHYKGSRVRRQPSESTVGSHQHSTISAGIADPSLVTCGVQRINSSTGSLWSPKASKNGASGLREPSGSSRALTEPRYHAAFSTGGGDASFRGDFRPGSGGLPLPPNSGRRSGDSGVATGRPSLSAFHPVSRAERAVVPQTPVDSARFLGSSTTNEKAASRSESFCCSPGMLPLQEAHLKYPPSSARSYASTASYATATVQKMPLPKTSRTSQRSKGESESSWPSADFLALTTARNTTSRRHTDSRSSQAIPTRRAAHSSCSERQIPNSPGRQSTQSGRHRTTSPASVTGRDSLISGSRRTVNPLINKLTLSAASDVQSPRHKDTAASSVIDSELYAGAHRESLRTQRFESSEAAAAFYRRSATSETLPEAVLSRPASQHRHKTRVNSKRKGKAEGGAQIDESGQAEKSSSDTKSSSASALDWSGFNGGFMSQVQKWIS